MTTARLRLKEEFEKRGLHHFARAIAHLPEQHHPKLDKEIPDNTPIGDCLMTFHWSGTPQGHSYWSLADSMISEDVIVTNHAAIGRIFGNVDRTLGTLEVLNENTVRSALRKAITEELTR